MLTPRFKLSQDENHVYITIHAPYTNIAETEIDVEGENFLFVSSPYFLRLHLPGKIIENDESKGLYACDSGDFNLTFDKLTPGENFENLDMITSLLAPRDIPDINPSLVEMLEEDGITIENVDEETQSENQFSYGFANKITTQFQDIGTEFPQIFELKVPEQVSMEERHELRIQHEDGKFSSDHYLADFFDDELVEPYLKATLYWTKPDFNKDTEFTEEEITLLKELPNKHYLLSQSEHRQILLGLVDILFGYCYDKRTTLNESTVESSWTINKLSSTLSWFCIFKDMRQVLVASYRRALIYPIFRNFDICTKVKKDLTSLFKNGKKFLIKCIIEIHQMFNASSDARYILNQLYIKDYLIFLQKCRNEELDELYKNIANIDIEKKDLGLELEELEHAADLVQQEESDFLDNQMAMKMASMTMSEKVNGTTSSFTDDSETDSSSDSTSDSSDDSSSELDSDDEPESS